MTIVDLQDPAQAKRKRVPTTLKVRLKTNNLVKARLCVRGGVMKGSQSHSFLSAPTADRHLLKILLSIAAWKYYEVVTCDISQASLQPDYLPENQKYIALPPPCVVLSSLSWDGTMSSESVAKQQRNERYAFLRHKPIYVSTDAPLRWYTKFARHLGRFQYYPRKVDLCLFSKRNALAGELVAVLVLHVDDIIMTGTIEEHAALLKCLDGFKHGDVQKLQQKGSIVYCGLTLVRKDSSIGMTQGDFRPSIQAVRRKDVIGPDSHLRSIDSLRSAIKAYVGCLIWMLRSRYDSSYWVVLLSTSVGTVLADTSLLPEFLLNCEKRRRS